MFYHSIKRQARCNPGQALHVKRSYCSWILPFLHTRGNWSLRLATASSPLRSLHQGTGLVSRTVHKKRFEVQLTGTCPKNSNQFEFVGLVAGTKFWSLCTKILCQKWLVHTMGLPRDFRFLQERVVGTSPVVCADLDDEQSLIPDKRLY